MSGAKIEDYPNLAGEVLKLHIDVYKAFVELLTSPQKAPDIKVLNANYAKNLSALSEYLQRRLNGEDLPPLDDRKDNRFKNPEWDKNPMLSFIKQFYFISSDWASDVAELSEGEGAVSFKFGLKQVLNTFAPTNVPFVNPEVVDEFVKTNGQSMLEGYKNFLGDLDSDGHWHLTTTDMNAFKIGESVATTPGKVIYQNDLIQLIQYEPTTEKVFETPILIMAPWVNKYYVMDLTEKNSFVKWLVDGGHTVFIVSWVNPGKKHADKSFENYLSEGLLDSINAIHEHTGAKGVNCIGYCIGGTLLASGLAYLKNPASSIKPRAKIKSATLIATLTDFSDIGDLGIFADEVWIRKIEEIMNQYGYLPGRIMFQTFNVMKANDMIWKSILRNYMLGKEPIKLDILYWNADYVNMAKTAHLFLLRNMYQKNLLREPNGISLLGTGIDLRLIDTPIFMFSTEKDHLAPWKRTYEGTKLFSGPTKFVLGGSGHVAGVVNPVSANKYCYWINDNLTDSVDDWRSNATKHDGSWWTEWNNWIKDFSGKLVPARKITSWIEEAPGSYVKNILYQVEKPREEHTAADCDVKKCSKARKPSARGKKG